MKSIITVNGKSIETDLIEIRIQSIPQFKVGDKVSATFNVLEDVWTVTGFVTCVAPDCIYLNEVKFPRTDCHFELV